MMSSSRTRYSTPKVSAPAGMNSVRSATSGMGSSSFREPGIDDPPVSLGADRNRLGARRAVRVVSQRSPMAFAAQTRCWDPHPHIVIRATFTESPGAIVGSISGGRVDDVAKRLAAQVGAEEVDET